MQKESIEFSRYRYGLDGHDIWVRFLGGTRDFSLLYIVQTVSGAHPAAYPLGTGGSLAEGKVAEA
jgi:hypothetical protein